MSVMGIPSHAAPYIPDEKYQPTTLTLAQKARIYYSQITGFVRSRMTAHNHNFLK